MGKRAMTTATRTETAARHLRISMAAGALYDLCFGIVNLAFPVWASGLLQIPLPAEQIYLRFSGVFLFILALVYMLPVIHPGRYLGVVVVAILGRAAGAVFLVSAALLYDQPPAFLILAGGDLFFACAHAFFLWKAKGGNPLRHYLDEVSADNPEDADVGPRGRGGSTGR